MSREAASRLRQQISHLRRERERFEEELLRPASLLRGSLIARHLGTGRQRRKRPAFYLSRVREEGGTRLVYIRKAELTRVRQAVGAYRVYREALIRLRKAGEDILEAFKRLGRAMEQSGP